ncbi:MAG TPA: ABC transporter ATP-binding protein, partial [Spirochaetia bacterium]|nr:ABC transporter ATP-binding protein [Spirochaetia bacterium]
TLGLVGESGCGKTTTGRCLLRAVEPTAGSIVAGLRDGRRLSVTTAGAEDLRTFRKEAQMIFQDPSSSLSPRMSVFDIVAEPLVVNQVMGGRALQDRVAELLTMVGLEPEHMRRYPHAFSGGQRQRIGIARALALNPRIIIADEPVSSLDVSIQAQIIALLKDFQERLGLSLLFITHDLRVVHHVCERVAVMYAGQIVEMASRTQLFETPSHPYTAALISAVPKILVDRSARPQRVVLRGEPVDLANIPAGCRFADRCSFVQEVCRQRMPELRTLADGRVARCHFAGGLPLKGIPEESLFEFEDIDLLIEQTTGERRQGGSTGCGP